MKTIDINLLGNSGKTPVKNTEMSTLNNDLIDPKSKNKAVFIVSASIIIFIISFAAWGFFIFSSKTIKTQIDDIEKEYEKLKPKLEELSYKAEKAKKLKTILEVKLLAKNQIEGGMYSWTDILNDVAEVVPKSIKITSISRQMTRGKTTGSKIEIKGKVGLSEDGTLALISYFVLNLNNNLNEASLIKNATIKEIKYNDNEDLYEFQISADVKKKTIEKKSAKPKKVENTVNDPVQGYSKMLVTKLPDTKITKIEELHLDKNTESLIAELPVSSFLMILEEDAEITKREVVKGEMRLVP